MAEGTFARIVGAICSNQLSILYRTIRFHQFALRYSRSAESYWRSVDDQVNLAKTMLTQGNIFLYLRQPGHALRRFDESLEINSRIESFGEVASSLSGKARAYIALEDYRLAKKHLDEAISLRKRHDDRRVGVEYENMGELYESQGDLSKALGWYTTTLSHCERYQPTFVPLCKRKIWLIKRRM